MPLDYQGPDGVFRVVTVDLGVARAAPGVEITYPTGESLDCTGLLVWKLTGSCYLRFNADTADAIPVEQFVWGNGCGWRDCLIRRVYVENVLQAGKTLVFHVTRPGVA